MAGWTAGCSSDSNEGLVRNLHAAGIVTQRRVLEAMLATDRSLYVPRLGEEGQRGKERSATYHYGPYADAPQPIGSKVTISAPHIHAYCLEALAKKIAAEGSRVLDVGCGSGILLGYMARMASAQQLPGGPGDRAPPGGARKDNLARDGFSLGPSPTPVSSPSSCAGRQCQIEVRQGDGWCGAADLGPFDAINVGAGAPQVPRQLLQQLRPGGLLLMPIGKGQNSQVLTRVGHRATQAEENGTKEGEEAALPALEMEVVREAVRFVPLVDEASFLQTSEGVNHRLESALSEGVGLREGADAFLAEAAAALLPGPASRVQEPLSASLGPPQREVLLLGEGQGRNAVHLARAHGHRCTAVDSSVVGLSKARRLAKQRGVGGLVETVAADLREFRPPPRSFDAVVSVFCMLPPADRRALHRRCLAALRPGGVVIVECFSPSHAGLRRPSASAKTFIERPRGSEG
eukprot:CAMPEP_0117649736 /NCGR_PEP_ID=MMETSP0804-20121206/1147_1 /TAXON_ID=1074897 /ORGANISM="Tetraselmis astigmatica, Strain CCMP880" /LENGTH=460 /DNA_ID=CAMNT_0005455525 /DNA_START=378 /DNA_END=1758 /DNA_ORIENTATION=+